MKKCASWRLAFAASAITFTCLASAQWAATYDSPNHTADESRLVATDRFGNSYVAGTGLVTAGHGKDIVVDSYDFFGIRRPFWPQSYDGPGQGDDIPTSIHVDSDGNVTVGGTSFGGTSTDYDYVLWKLKPNGDPFWTGVTGPGLTYHGGAIRTNSGDKEGLYDQTGPHCQMVVKDSYDPAQRITAMTGTAIIFLDGQPRKVWRTMILEPDPLNASRVQLKAGWPVDTTALITKGIGFHPTDNTLYVTGEERNENTNQTILTTIRFKAAGSSGGFSPYIWRDDFRSSNQIFAESAGLRVDTDGSVYVAGTEDTGTQYGRDYVVYKIGQDAPSHLWTSFYHSQIGDAFDGPDEARAIALTHVVEEGLSKPLSMLRASRTDSCHSRAMTSQQFDSEVTMVTCFGQPRTTPSCALTEAPSRAMTNRSQSSGQVVTSMWRDAW